LPYLFQGVTLKQLYFVTQFLLQMKVLKFGGTSVGSASRIKKLIEIINPHQTQIIVLSAIAGTTNSLVEISKSFSSNESQKGIIMLKDLRKQYDELIEELHHDNNYKQQSINLINYHFGLIENLSADIVTTAEEKIILAQGELISTGLFYNYLQEIGISAKLLSALTFMKIDENNEPIISYIQEKLLPQIDANNTPTIYITQGYICRNTFNNIDNLRRGGSDFSASLIGAAIKAEEIQIWTDIDGMHNNDPRVVTGTKPIAQLSFQEAAELAYFGAKILHPQSIFPAQKYNIPVRLLNTLEPDKKGTLISEKGQEKEGVQAIAAKNDITVIHIHSSRMLMAYGFLRKVFEVFERYKTPIDMITTSEVAVSITIDDEFYLKEILADLSVFGEVSSYNNKTIVCVVGNFKKNSHSYAARILDAVKHLPIQMISYGGSDFNVSFLLDTEYKTEALRSLHSRLF